MQWYSPSIRPFRASTSTALRAEYEYRGAEYEIGLCEKVHRHSSNRPLPQIAPVGANVFSSVPEPRALPVGYHRLCRWHTFRPKISTRANQASKFPLGAEFADFIAWLGFSRHFGGCDEPNRSSLCKHYHAIRVDRRSEVDQVVIGRVKFQES